MKRYLLYINILVLSLLGYSSVAQDFDNFYHGVSNFSEEKYETAIEYFSKALNDNLDNEVILKYLAESYFALNDINASIREYEKLKEFNITDASFGLAICYADLEKTDLAIKELRLYLSQSDKESRGFVRINSKFGKINDSEEWEKLWFNEWYDKYDDLYDEAEYNFIKGNNVRAFEFIEELIESRPRHHKAFALRAKIYENTGDLKKARDDYSIAIKIKKKQASYYKGRAEIYKQLEKYESAYDDLKLAYSLDRYSPEYMFLIAEELFLMEKPEEARKELSQYLRFFSNDEEAIYLYGKCYFSSEEYDKAIDQFSKLIETNKGEPKYFLGRGNCYIMLEEMDKAEDDLSMALDLNPQLAQVYMSRGIARLANDDMEAACNDFNKAYKFGYLKAIEMIQLHCNK